MTKRILTISLLLGAIVAGSSAILPKKENGPVIATSVIEVSVKKSFALLEKSGYLFTSHSALKCASCHNNTLTAMTAELAGQKGMPVTASLRVDRVGSMVPGRCLHRLAADRLAGAIQESEHHFLRDRRTD